MNVCDADVVHSLPMSRIRMNRSPPTWFPGTMRQQAVVRYARTAGAAKCSVGTIVVGASFLRRNAAGTRDREAGGNDSAVSSTSMREARL